MLLDLIGFIVILFILAVGFFVFAFCVWISGKARKVLHKVGIIKPPKKVTK